MMDGLLVIELKNWNKVRQRRVVVEKGNDRGGKISQVKSSIDKVKVGLTHATAVLLDSYPSDVWDATTLGEQFFFQDQSGPAAPL